MNKLLGSVGLMVVVTGCAADDGSLQVFAALVPTGSCGFDPTSTLAKFSGTYDPRGFAGEAPDAYYLGLGVANNLPKNVSDGETKEDANDVTIRGADVCWIRADPEGGKAAAIGFEDFAGGIPDALACDKQPAAQRTFFPSSGFVSAGGGKGVVLVRALDLTGLRSLYGAAFTPMEILPFGPVPVPAGNTILWKYSNGAADPRDKAARAPEWGTYPSTVSARVLILARAVGQLQSGGDARSAWFVFPVDVCVGCAPTACGLADYKQCSGDQCTDPDHPCNDARVCADGSVCTSITTTCANGAACPPVTCLSGPTCDPGIWAYSGLVPDPTGCLPFQDGGAECLSFDACNPGG